MLHIGNCSICMDMEAMVMDITVTMILPVTITTTAIITPKARWQAIS